MYCGNTLSRIIILWLFNLKNDAYPFQNLNHMTTECFVSNKTRPSPEAGTGSAQIEFHGWLLPLEM